MQHEGQLSRENLKNSYKTKKMQVVAEEEPESLEQSEELWQNKLCTLPDNTEPPCSGSERPGIKAALPMFLSLHPQLIFPITDIQSSQTKTNSEKCCKNTVLSCMSSSTWGLAHSYTSKTILTRPLLVYFSH